MPSTNALDQAYIILQEQAASASPDEIRGSEPFTADEPLGVGAPLRVLTLEANGRPFALFALTLPTVSLADSALLGYLGRRGRARQARWLALGSLREWALLPLPEGPVDSPEPLRQYPAVLTIGPTACDELAPLERIAVTERVDRILRDLGSLLRDGSVDLVIPDADFFVHRLIRAVEVLRPEVSRALRTKLQMEPVYGRQLGEWALRQGIPADLRSDEFVEAVVRQSVYRLLGKIIFYQSLRRVAPQLPPTDLAGIDTGEVLPRLRHCFAAAHRIDYHAVFRDDIVDQLPFPAAASSELRDLVTDLNTRDFAHLPQDVVGAVFERLIPPEDRHALGQYFTPEPLVDLVLAFCVRDPDDLVLDPTCGTGTFLIRAYDRLRTRLGVHDHRRLLGQLWGVDIAPFPAELATINLFRQQIGDAGNFPRILNEDFFDIVPGGAYRFPPLHDPEGDDTSEQHVPFDTWVDEKIPLFDAIVGNFPYIGASQIDRAIKGYRASVERRVIEDWFDSYPQGFRFEKKADALEHERVRREGLPLEPLAKRASVDVSSFADLYVYLFWHAAAFLREGGRMGIVTSNAWLDAGYGHALQRFLLDHFKIVAVLESRCEPWFEQAAVNTVVTIVERCGDATERDASSARFVQIREPLATMIPWDPHADPLRRWLGLDALRERVEQVYEASDDVNVPVTAEDGAFRIRALRQGALRHEVETRGQTVKWGRYLRAPQVYFDLLGAANDKLTLLQSIAPPQFGSKTGNNSFFHLDEAAAQMWQIEDEFLLPLLKSPGETNSIAIDPADLSLKVFVCRRTKEELREAGKINALRYIEWGEQQVFDSGSQAGLTWPHGAEVRDRKPGWYALPEYRSRSAQIFLPKAVGDRHVIRYSTEPLIADCRLYFLQPRNGVLPGEVAAVLNSSVVAFFLELTGRVTLGDGVLDMMVDDARHYLQVPDIASMPQVWRNAAVEALTPLLKRPVVSVFEEIGKADRRALDSAVLQGMGLDPEVWLPRIYDGLTTLVRERVQLGQMRAKARKSRPHRAAKRVADDVLEDLLPNGPTPFPDGFLSAQARGGKSSVVELPDKPVRHVGHMFGKEELANEDGFRLEVTRFEARYILCGQRAGRRSVRIPEAQVEVSRAVNAYMRYLRDLRQSLFDAHYSRTLDQQASERFVAQVWRQFNLPEPEE